MIPPRAEPTALSPLDKPPLEIAPQTADMPEPNAEPMPPIAVPMLPRIPVCGTPAAACPATIAGDKPSAILIGFAMAKATIRLMVSVRMRQMLLAPPAKPLTISLTMLSTPSAT